MSSVPSPITGQTLTPADQARGSAAGVQARRAKMAQRTQRIALADRIIEEGSIGTDALAVCATILERADQLAAVVSADTALDLQRLAETASTLHKIHRLVTGQSTSNAASLHVDVADVEARRAELLARLHALDVDSTVGMDHASSQQDGPPPPS